MVRLLTILLLLPALLFGQVNRFAGFGHGAATNVPDADSIAFVTKVANNGGSLTTTEKTAIGTLIKQLKDSSLWALCKAIYPMVGASDAACRVNLKDTINFNLSFVASPTFSSNGVDWNGTTQYANTNLTPSVTLSLNSTHTSYYSRENVQEAKVALGDADGSNNLVSYLRYTTDLFYISNNATTVSLFSVANTDSRGLFVNSRVASTTVINSKNGVSTTSGATFNSVGLPTNVLYLAARRNSANVADLFATTQCAFASIGLGLTTAQIATLYNIVQAFETTLGRQV